MSISIVETQVKTWSRISVPADFKIHFVELVLIDSYFGCTTGSRNEVEPAKEIVKVHSFIAALTYFAHFATGAQCTKIAKLSQFTLLPSNTSQLVTRRKSKATPVPVLQLYIW